MLAGCAAGIAPTAYLTITVRFPFRPIKIPSCSLSYPSSQMPLQSWNRHSACFVHSPPPPQNWGSRLNKSQPRIIPDSAAAANLTLNLAKARTCFLWQIRTVLSQRLHVRNGFAYAATNKVFAGIILPLTLDTSKSLSCQNLPSKRDLVSFALRLLAGKPRRQEISWKPASFELLRPLFRIYQIDNRLPVTPRDRLLFNPRKPSALTARGLCSLATWTFRSTAFILNQTCNASRK